MATTPSGLSGHSAPSHVMEELNIARGNVIIHDRQMVGMTAEKWDKLRSTENVTHRIVQVKFSMLEIKEKFTFLKLLGLCKNCHNCVTRGKVK